MAKFQGDLKILPISSLHENPNNIRDGYNPDKVEFIAGEIKQFGILQPLSVYPHPDLEGDYMIRDGNHRYLAALKIQESDIPCIVSPATKRDGVADVDAMMSTGLSHTPLNEIGVSNGIQRYLDLGLDITTVGKKRKMSRTEVKTRAKLAGKPEVAELVTRGTIDVLGAAEIFGVEKETGDASIFDSLVDELNGSRWSKSQVEVTRMVEQKKSNARRNKLREELTELGAVEIDSRNRYSGKWSKSEEILDVEGHIAEGHQFDVSTPDSVDWWEKSKGLVKAQASPEEKARRERIRSLDGVLPDVQRARHKYVVDKVRNKKGMEDRNARGLLITMIFERATRSDSAGLEAIAEVVSIAYPEYDYEAGMLYAEHCGLVTAWEEKVQAALMGLSLPQLSLLLAYAPVAAEDRKLGKTNWYLRDSPDKEARWAPLARWYQQLIDFAGYVPSDEEAEMIRMAEIDRKDPANDVRLPSATCKDCSQEVVADSEWAGHCVNCIDDAEDSE